MSSSNREKVIIFGTNQLASLAHFYFDHDTNFETVAFTVDADYLKSSDFRGLPVISFENILSVYPPDQYKLFIPISFKKMSFVRKQKFEEAKKMGYTCVSYVSSKATTWPDLKIGENCFIFEDNTIQPFVSIGDNCIFWSGNHIGHHTQIGNHVFLTSHVVISGCCNIGNNSFFGVNSTVRDETNIGEGTLVGMGAIITKDTRPYSVWHGSKSVEKDQRSIDLDSLSHKSNG